MREFWTASEVADRFRVHVSTVYRWANEGELPVVILPGGRGRRFRTEDVEKLATIHAPEGSAA